MGRITPARRYTVTLHLLAAGGNTGSYHHESDISDTDGLEIPSICSRSSEVDFAGRRSSEFDASAVGTILPLRDTYVPDVARDYHCRNARG